VLPPPVLELSAGHNRALGHHVRVVSLMPRLPATGDRLALVGVGPRLGIHVDLGQLVSSVVHCQLQLSLPPSLQPPFLLRPLLLPKPLPVRSHTPCPIHVQQERIALLHPALTRVSAGLGVELLDLPVELLLSEQLLPTGFYFESHLAALAQVPTADV
jgi:hypothetical protein